MSLQDSAARPCPKPEKSSHPHTLFKNHFKIKPPYTLINARGLVSSSFHVHMCIFIPLPNMHPTCPANLILYLPTVLSSL